MRSLRSPGWFRATGLVFSRRQFREAPRLPCCTFTLSLMPQVDFTIRNENGFRYVDEGSGSDLPPVVLLHGMLGDLSNWIDTIQALADHSYRVLVPVLPVYEMPTKQTSVYGLVDYVHRFLESLGVRETVMVGNSLGGHVALVFALQYSQAVRALVLSGASGIYEVNIGTSTPQRRNRAFIRDRTAMTFYDPVHATDELVDEMFELVNDRTRVIRLIKMARSAKAVTVTDELSQIPQPTLLVWGQDDQITPPEVGEEFKERMPNAELHFIDECGHAPMIEHPAAFNRLTLDFLGRTVGEPSMAS